MRQQGERRKPIKSWGGNKTKQKTNQNMEVAHERKNS